MVACSLVFFFLNFSQNRKLFENCVECDGDDDDNENDVNEISGEEESLDDEYDHCICCSSDGVRTGIL